MIDAIAEKLPVRGWGLKDSYNCLDLVPHGFTKLLEATWLWRDASLLEGTHSKDFEWHRIETTRELLRWEQAWSGGESIDQSCRLFKPALLSDPGVTFLGAWQSSELVAGFVVSLSEAVTGLSNLFSTANEAGVWISAVQTAQLRYPGSPLVGYEYGADLQQAMRAGFAPLHSLAVWIRSGS